MKNCKKILLSLIFLVVACSHLAPIENISNAPIPAGNRALSTTEVGSVIAKAAIDRGWSVTQVASTKLHATLKNHDTNIEEVNITYSESSYSITYASSHNMDVANGMISTTYNRYIDYLNMSISKGLNTAVF